MKVLHAHSGNLFGGVETVLLTLSKFEAVASIRSEYALCYEGRLSQKLQELGARVYWLGNARARAPWSVWRARRRLKRLLSDGSFDVAITHGFWAHFMFGGVIRRARVPRVHWAHDVSDGKHWLERWAKISVPPSLILANSRFTASHLREIFQATRIEVLHPLSAAPDFNRENRDKVRQRLGAEKTDSVIVMTSRFEHWKGHQSLIDALSQIKNLPHWVCWICGEPQREGEEHYLAQLKSQVQESHLSNRVRFLGHVDPVDSVLRAADIHCQPNSGPEPFGLAFVEALYAGLPVVTTAFGGALEIVDKSCGILIPPGDRDALSAALQALIQDGRRRKQLGDAGPAHAKQLCDPQQQLRTLARHLEQLKDGGGATS